jgi:hypothetical protein
MKLLQLKDTLPAKDFSELEEIFLLNSKGKRFENVSAEVKIFQLKQLGVEDPLTATTIRKIVETYSVAHLDASDQQHMCK